MFLPHMWNLNNRILFFYWSVVALQIYVRFCCKTKWIIYIGTYIPSLWNLPFHTPPNPPLLVITKYLAKLPVLYSSSTLAILYLVVYIYQPYSPHSSHPLLPPLHPHSHSLHLQLFSCPANKFICTIFLGSIHMH